jgi:hypothetical protein
MNFFLKVLAMERFTTFFIKNNNDEVFNAGKKIVAMKHLTLLKN